MRITDQRYLHNYQKLLDFDLEAVWLNSNFEQTQIDLSYRIQASAVFSANIEGNSIDLNSFMNAKLSKEIFKSPKEMQEIEDLIAAYEFAKANELNEQNLLELHKILSQNILVNFRQGTYRNDKMGVFDANGLVYLAIEAEYVSEKIKELLSDIHLLFNQSMSIKESFYHAALIHLKFVHIHPFWDGNGRTARLLEKWFLAKKIDDRAWKIQSERYYKEHLSDYYSNINLGANYYVLDYDKCAPFLAMLAKSLLQER